MYALPLDIFRIMAGLLCAAYFATLALQAQDFSNPDGLLDHALLHRIFWFTRLSLFHPGLSLAFFYGIFGLAFVGAWGIVLGYRVKLCAAALFLIAVSTYRWNFIVIYVDDGFMHLLLFWLMFLPVGHTLCLPDFLASPLARRWRWAHLTVPGTAARCFLCNVSLVYLLAGLWKLESPLWRQGFALYAALHLPVAYTPEFWGPQHLPWLQVANHFALIIEPLIPLLLWWRRDHPLKWCGLFCQIGFHVAILSTFKIPFVNLGLMATALLFFQAEIVQRLCRPWRPSPIQQRPRLDPAGRYALVFLLVLSLAVMRRIPLLGVFHKPAYALLWTVGIAQDYHLFNWIDKVNYHVTYRVIIQSHTGAQQSLAPSTLFPSSLRASLLQAYLYNVRWMFIPRQHRLALRQSILARSAQRFCRKHTQDGIVTAWSRVQRILPDNPHLSRGEERFLLTFRCEEKRAVLCSTFLEQLHRTDCEPSARPTLSGT